MIGIYKIQNIKNGKSYIGSAKNIKKRWNEHKSSLTRGNHHSLKLQRAWNKYGENSFLFQIMEIIEIPGDLLSCEQKWIDITKSASILGYNVCPVAGSSLGRKFSDATKIKMSQKAIGRVVSKETRLKQSSARFGVKKSEQHRKNISTGQKGKVIPQQTRIAVGNANRLRVITDETRSKLRIASAKSAEINKSKSKLTPVILSQMISQCEYDKYGRIRGGMVAMWALEHGLSRSCISQRLRKFRAMNDMVIPEQKQITPPARRLETVDADTGEILEVA